jgi:ABC-type glycerol-3-phosphate transport system substrate-binding protein
MKTSNKRRMILFLIVIAAFITAIVFSACSNGTTGSRGGSKSGGGTVTVITLAAIPGVKATNDKINDTDQYTGTVKWENYPASATEIIYVATITLSPKSGYTLKGVAANFFTVSGATTANDKDSGVVTAIFPPKTK